LPVWVYVVLGVVVAAPVALSSQSLYRWSCSPLGLNLPWWWAVAVFTATDGGALVCVALTMVAAHRGESGGVAHLLVWLLAGLSAYANYQAGVELDARDAVWFLPAMSLLAVVMVEVVARAVRRWVRVVAGVVEPALPRFRFLRWVFAPAETFAALRVAVLDGISDHCQAVTAVRQRRNSVPPVSAPADTELLVASKADAVRLAVAATGSTDVEELAAWLSARGVTVSRTYLARIAGQSGRPYLAAVGDDT
jgi:hypothetical protein